MNKFAKAAVLASLAVASAAPALAADTSTSTTATNQEFYGDFMTYLSDQMDYFSALNVAVGAKDGDAVSTAFAKMMKSEGALYDFLNTLVVTKA